MSREKRNEDEWLRDQAEAEQNQGEERALTVTRLAPQCRRTRRAVLVWSCKTPIHVSCSPISWTSSGVTAVRGG